MIGDIIMLAGYMPIWANDIKDDGFEINDDTVGSTADTTDSTGAPNAEDATKLAACDARPVSDDGTKLAKLDNPARLTGGRLKDGNADATDSAPV